MTWPARSTLVVLALLSFSSAFADLRMRAYGSRPYDEFIPAVVSGTADAPERYRVLLPFTIAGISNAVGLSLANAWHLVRFISFVAAYVLMFAYLRRWFGETTSLFGTTLVAATLPLTFTNSWAHPDHIAELALFTAGCAAIAANRVWLLAIILAVATLNRETAVFLVPLYLLTAPSVRERVIWTLALTAEWAGVFVALRVWRGFVHYDYFQAQRNLQFLKLLPSAYDPYYRIYAYFAIVLFGGLLLVAAAASGPRPLFISRALLVVPLFCLVAFSISSIIESRIFTPLYPLIMPAVMFGWRQFDNDGRYRSDAGENRE
jgi:hypothetical protein